MLVEATFANALELDIWSNLLARHFMEYKYLTSGISQGNPGAAQFQFKELQSTDKLEIIFGGNVNSEETEHDTCRKRRDCSSGTSVNDEEDKYLCDTTAVSRADKIRCTEDFASGRTTPISAPHKFKATWAPPVHKAFIDLCLEETLKGNKPGTHFNRDGWKNILESFHNRTGLKYTRMQLKNHWDSTKEQWKIWCKLVEANILGASDEVWTSYLQVVGYFNLFSCVYSFIFLEWMSHDFVIVIRSFVMGWILNTGFPLLQENPEAAQFHNRELQFADKLDTIFDYTPNAGEKIYYSASPLQTVKPEIMQPEDETPERPCDPFESDSDTIIKKNVVRAPAPLTHNKLTYSIGECIDCLDSLQELEQGSELYLFALDVFLKKEYREIFLQLKNSGLRISWLQRLQANGQPLQL